MVYYLVLDNNRMSDSSFATILEGIRDQGKHLRSLMYSRNEMGPDSLAVLDKILPNLRDLRVHQLSFLFDS